MMRKCHLEPNKALICCHMLPLVQREMDVLEQNTLFRGTEHSNLCNVLYLNRNTGLIVLQGKKNVNAKLRGTVYLFQ